MSKIVIALGGNALGKTPSEQLSLVRETSKNIVDLVEMGNQVIVSHGNGPQVGMIYNNMVSSDMPFAECGAMSQGYIGYHLQQAIQRELATRGIKKDVATIITQVEVDKNDPGFNDPTKPIGVFYTEEEAKKLEETITNQEELINSKKETISQAEAKIDKLTKTMEKYGL